MFIYLTCQKLNAAQMVAHNAINDKVMGLIPIVTSDNMYNLNAMWVAWDKNIYQRYKTPPIKGLLARGTLNSLDVLSVMPCVSQGLFCLYPSIRTFWCVRMPKHNTHNIV